MNKLQRLLFGEVRDYAKAQSFDIVIAEGVLYATPAVDITAAVLNVLKTKPVAAAGRPRRLPSHPRSPRNGLSRRAPTARPMTLGARARCS